MAETSASETCPSKPRNTSRRISVPPERLFRGGTNTENNQNGGSRRTMTPWLSSVCEQESDEPSNVLPPYTHSGRPATKTRSLFIATY